MLKRRTAAALAFSFICGLACWVGCDSDTSSSNLTQDTSDTSNTNVIRMAFSSQNPDFNRDGRPDIGGYDGNEDWRVALSNGSGFDIVPGSSWDTKWNLDWPEQFIFPMNVIRGS